MSTFNPNAFLAEEIGDAIGAYGRTDNYLHCLACGTRENSEGQIWHLAGCENHKKVEAVMALVRAALKRQRHLVREALAVVEEEVGG